MASKAGDGTVYAITCLCRRSSALAEIVTHPRLPQTRSASDYLLNCGFVAEQGSGIFAVKCRSRQGPVDMVAPAPRRSQCSDDHHALFALLTARAPFPFDEQCPTITTTLELFTGSIAAEDANQLHSLFRNIITCLYRSKRSPPLSLFTRDGHARLTSDQQGGRLLLYMSVPEGYRDSHCQLPVQTR